MPAPACYPAVLATYNAANNAACATMPATMQVAHCDNATAGDNAECEHRKDWGWEPCDNANQVTMPQARSGSHLAPVDCTTLLPVA